MASCAANINGNGCTLLESSDGSVTITQDGREFDLVVVPSASQAGPFVNVKHAPYNAAGDGVTNDTAAIQAAIDAAEGVVFLPAGEYVVDELTFHTNTVLLGEGPRDAGRGTGLTYGGAGWALRSSTPGTRIFNVNISHLTVACTAAAAGGLELDSVSSGYFEELVIVAAANGTALRIHSPTTGFSVYNTFIGCRFFTSDIGTKLDGTSSNENRFIACRWNACTTRGVEIVDSNHNLFIGGAFEANGVAWHVTATGAGLSNANLISYARFESNTGVAIQIGANVSYTQVANVDYVGGAGFITDAGGSTQVTGAVAPGTLGPFQVKSNTQVSPFYFERTAHGGSETSAFHVKDSNSSVGTPVTFLVETERGVGWFLRLKRGGSTLYDIDVNGIVTTQAYRSGAATPAGSVTPNFIGEEYLDTSGPTWHKSTGLTDADWVALN